MAETTLPTPPRWSRDFSGPLTATGEEVVVIEPGRSLWRLGMPLPPSSQSQRHQQQEGPLAVQEASVCLARGMGVMVHADTKHEYVGIEEQIKVSGRSIHTGAGYGHPGYLERYERCLARKGVLARDDSEGCPGGTHAARDHFRRLLRYSLEHRLKLQKTAVQQPSDCTRSLLLVVEPSRDDWRQVCSSRDADGKQEGPMYWFNKLTQVTTWEPQDEMAVMMFDLAFESDFGFRRVMLVRKPEVVVDFLGVGRGSQQESVVVDIGADATSVCVVDENGELIADSLITGEANLSMENLARELAVRLRSPDVSVSRRANAITDLDLFSRLAVHCVCPAAAGAAPRDDEEFPGSITVELPPDIPLEAESLTLLTISGGDRCKSVEAAFFADTRATVAGGGETRQQTLPEAVMASVAVLDDREQRHKALENIIVMGGGATIPGIAERLESELRLNHDVPAPHVLVPSDPDTVAYRAGESFAARVAPREEEGDWDQSQIAKLWFLREHHLTVDCGEYVPALDYPASKGSLIKAART